MRCLFATTGGAGHFGPLIPLARAAIASGHEVRVAAPKAFESSVVDAGFDFGPLGERSDAERDAMFARMMAASFDEANAIMLRDGFAGIYPRAALPAMIELLDGWRPDVVVREELEFASFVAAERRGIRHVQVATGLLSTQSHFRPQLSDAVDGLLREAGIPAERATVQVDEPRLSLTPPSLEAPEDRSRAQRFRALDSAPPRTSNADRPLIFLTFGSEAAAQRFFPDLYRATIEALADDSVDVLVAVGLSGEPAALGPLPTGVRVERWVDQAEVLPRAALVVCHGGYGTMIGALAAGTPLVVIPLFAADQWMNGTRIAEVGAGLALEGAADLPRLPEAVDRALREPEFGQRAQALAQEIAALPPAQEAITALEMLVRSA